MFLCVYQELSPLEKRRAVAQHQDDITGTAYGLLPIASADDPLIKVYEKIIAIRNATTLEQRHALIDEGLQQSHDDPLHDFCFLQISQSAGTADEDWALNILARWIPKAIRDQQHQKPATGNPARSLLGRADKVTACLEKIAASSTIPNNKLRALSLLLQWMALDDGVCAGQISHLPRFVENAPTSPRDLLSDDLRNVLIRRLATNPYILPSQREDQKKISTWLSAVQQYP
jgi:hypothetical protein